MREDTVRFREVDLQRLEVLLCDADGNLFGSEEPAFVASTAVTNEFLASLGVERTFTVDELRQLALGRNFRSTAEELAAEAGKEIESDTLDAWVLAEQRAVVAHLGGVLRPDPAVTTPLAFLARQFRLALVSSSAEARLAACLHAAGLEDYFSSEVRFSAEDSLPVPTSKPDPAIYTFAGEQLGVDGSAALAVEDAEPGVAAAVAAGFPVVGNLQFVAPDEREQRAATLREAGVAAIVTSWSGLAQLLGCDVEARMRFQDAGARA